MVSFMRWRVSTKAIGLSICLAAFLVGAGVDAYMRANVGMRCFGCSNLTCRIVDVADHPVFLFTHPVETFDYLFINP